MKHEMAEHFLQNFFHDTGILLWNRTFLNWNIILLLYFYSVGEVPFQGVWILRENLSVKSCSILFLKTSAIRFTKIILSDIGANMADSMYQGVYNGKKRHEPDFENVISRAVSNGVTKLIITGTDLQSSKTALDMAKQNGNTWRYTLQKECTSLSHGSYIFINHV